MGRSSVTKHLAPALANVTHPASRTTASLRNIASQACINFDQLTIGTVPFLLTVP